MERNRRQTQWRSVSDRINDKIVFTEEFAGEDWQARALDLSPWADQKVTVELRTNCIDGNSAYDWAVFGQPMLVTLPKDTTLNPGIDNLVGLAVAEITCETPSSVLLTMSDIHEKAHLEKGVHCIPSISKTTRNPN